MYLDILNFIFLLLTEYLLLSDCWLYVDLQVILNGTQMW